LSRKFPQATEQAGLFDIAASVPLSGSEGLNLGAVTGDD
jgi:hypothetical protein